MSDNSCNRYRICFDILLAYWATLGACWWKCQNKKDWFAAVKTPCNEYPPAVFVCWHSNRLSMIRCKGTGFDGELKVFCLLTVDVTPMIFFIWFCGLLLILLVSCTANSIVLTCFFLSSYQHTERSVYFFVCVQILSMICTQ